MIVCYVYGAVHHLTPDQVHRIRQWFWRSSFGERYKVGGEGFVSNDLKTVHNYVIDCSGSAADFGKPPTETEWMNIAFRSNVSRSRAYILALAARHPRNLTNGSYIDPSVALSGYNKKQFHHVYPRAHLRRAGLDSNDNLLINICMIAAVANNAISNSDPSSYLPKLAATLGAIGDDVFASNLLPMPSAFDYSKATYDEFLKERAPIVMGFVSKLCDGDVP